MLALMKRFSANCCSWFLYPTWWYWLWQRLSLAKLAALQQPQNYRLDVSEQMLANSLQNTRAETHLVKWKAWHRCRITPGCQLLVFTSPLQYIENMHVALKRRGWGWLHRAYIIITDYPAALAKGAQRTFTANNEEISIKIMHPVEQVIERAKQLNLSVIRLTEKIIDETCAPIMNNSPCMLWKWKAHQIYGLLLQKQMAQ